MKLPIKDRTTAGQHLAQALSAYQDREDVLVLALPRGGVTVAHQVAKALNVKLDILLVRKLGCPGQKELAMGAIASGGLRVLNDDVVRLLAIPDKVIDEVAAEEQRELERRERAYRGEHSRPEIASKYIILVDDGIATGATMRAAIAALRQQNPAGIIVAVPVAPAKTIELLAGEADKVICLATPEPFTAIGNWYMDFSQVPDQQVNQILSQAWMDSS
ncbi:phosphoribosyltransferase [Methylophaga sp. OBS4]|uniref:phosphoribosyltransferase n=1 Tax=Methylophaga sp. OBS4 TaxID=2991935 RepID=UPI002257AA8B|nr:phosphoribosyltransferase [Methylophaga sp. OBS4]MCX4187685.1 phosphoribosyltransferase [Methylophaga sp. OBS4]